MPRNVEEGIYPLFVEEHTASRIRRHMEEMKCKKVSYGLRLLKLFRILDDLTLVARDGYVMELLPLVEMRIIIDWPYLQLCIAIDVRFAEYDGLL